MSWICFISICERFMSGKMDETQSILVSLAVILLDHRVRAYRLINSLRQKRSGGNGYLI